MKVLCFFIRFCGTLSTPLALDPSSKEVVLLNFRFEVCWTQQYRAFFCFQQPFTLRFYPCSDDFSDERRIQNKQYVISLVAQNYRLLQLFCYIARRRLLRPSIMKLFVSVATLLRLRLQLASYCFQLRFNSDKLRVFFSNTGYCFCCRIIRYKPRLLA